MRFAIFSDIHSNLEALEAVMADARRRRCTDFVCLGDVVGYNANPSECIQLIRELDCPVVKGNHDEQATFTESSERFNELAERAIEWTRERLNEPDREWLGTLPLQQRVHDFTIVHATLDTPGQWGYVFNNLDAVASFTYQRTTVCFFATRASVVRPPSTFVSRLAKNISLTPAAWANLVTETGAPHIAFTTSRTRSSNCCE
jgi:hypothetical protein